MVEGTSATAQSNQAAPDWQSLLGQAIRQYVAESPLNRLRDIDGSPIYEEPVVGFADGDDSLFDLYKTVIGAFHLAPREVLTAHARAMIASEPREYERVGVVSWILPVAKETKLSNRRMTEGPSRRWNHTRFQGEDFNDSLRRHVVAFLQRQGFVAVAPMLADYFRTYGLPDGPASNWSERHAAYAAGLGTFSLSDGLISARGIAHRCGSVVVGATLVASPRPYSDHLEYCPYPRDGSCGVCISRCPAGAIGPSGHDKVKCQDYLFVRQAEWLKRPGYIGSYSGCGLCQTKVPCESRIPRQSSSQQRI